MTRFDSNPSSRSTLFQPEDLTEDNFVLKAPRNADGVPTLGGIPLIRKIGQGGMGAVYYGVHPRLNSDVAIKVLPFHLAEQDATMIKRFVSEARIAVQVKSPNIVNVLDINEEGGIYYLVMEFVNGMPSSSVLKKILAGEPVPPVPEGVGAMPEWVALDICIGATEGLKTAHAFDIIHRDVKPDNILVPREAGKQADPPLDFIHCKLADLGLAKTESSLTIGTMANASMGTPGYMPPEQVMDAKNATKASDIFAMGATLYSLLAGQPPFSGGSIGQIMINTCSMPHTPLTDFRPDVSAATRQLIDYCLQKEPEQRYPNAAELLSALKQARAGVPSDLSPGDAQTLQLGAAPVMIKPPSTSSTNRPTDPTLQMARDDAVAETLLIDTPNAAGSHAHTATGDTPTAVTLAGSTPARSGTGSRWAIILISVVVLAVAGVYFLSIAPAQHYRKTVSIAQRAESDAGNISDPVASRANWQSARQAWRDVAALRPDDTQAQDAIARIDARLAAIDQYKSAVKDASKSVGAADTLGDDPKAIALWTAAADQYQRALALFPGDDIANSGLNAAKSRIKSLEQSRDRALEVALNTARNAENLAAQSSDPIKARSVWRDALKNYNNVLAVRKDYPDALTGQRRVKKKLADIDQYEKAVTAAREWVRKGNGLTDGQSVRQAWQRAVTMYDTALKLFNSGPATTERAAVVKRIADSEAADRKYADAMARATQAVQKAADSSRPADKRAFLDTALKQYNAALGIRASSAEALNGETKAQSLLAAIDRYDAYMKAATARETELEAETNPVYGKRLADQVKLAVDKALAEFPDDPDAQALEDRVAEQLLRLEQIEAKQKAEAAAKAAAATQNAKPPVPEVNRDRYRNIVKIKSLTAHSRQIIDLVFSPDGTRFVTASRDKTAIIWNAQTGDPVHTLSGHTGYVNSAVFSPDNRQVLTASSDKTARLWDAQTGKLIRTFSGHTRTVTDAVFSPDGTRIATASGDKTARIWNVSGDGMVVVLKGHARKIAHVVFSPDGARLLTASADGTARVWDAINGSVLFTFNGLYPWVENAGYSPDGKRIEVTTTQDDGGVSFSQVQVWDAASGRVIVELTRKNAMRSTQFDRTSSKILTACDDATAEIWDINTGNVVTIFRGHTKAVNDAVFSPDDTVVFTGSADNTLRVWNAENGELIALLQGHSDFVDRVLVSADDTRAVSMCRDNSMILWRIPAGGDAGDVRP